MGKEQLEPAVSEDRRKTLLQKAERLKKMSKEQREERRQWAVDTIATPPDGIQCSRCGNTGFITGDNIDGYETVTPCPACYERRQVARRLKASGISPEDYENCRLTTFMADTEISRQMLSMANAYLTSRQPGQGFGLFGTAGTGKTHLCIAVCQEITRKYNEPHYYFSYRTEMPALIKALKSYSNTYDDAVRRWKECDNLYIDDLFKMAVRSGTDKNPASIEPDDLKVMFDIINARYMNKKATLFSSEIAVNELSQIDGALGSRIYAMIKPYGMKVTGENRRLQGGTVA